jgi:hypothetical protein
VADLVDFHAARPLSMWDLCRTVATGAGPRTVWEMLHRRPDPDIAGEDGMRASDTELMHLVWLADGSSRLLRWRFVS